MSQTIDTLTIEIESNAANSVDGVRKLSRALTSLSKSISSVNGAGIGNVAGSLNTMSGAFSGVSNSTEKASSGTKKYVGTLPTLTNYTNRATNSTKSLAYYFGKFYANMFLVIRGAKMLGNAISDTMGYMESFNFWDVAINSATAKTDEWKELGYADTEAYAHAFKQGLADFNEKMIGFKTNTESGDISVSGISNLGINLTNLTTFQAEIVSITSSLGLCTAVSKDTSKALSMLVADMSSLKNIDLKTVMNNFQSGLIGQSRALYKYGIDITNATLQTYAYKYGVEKAVSEMTQAEKMQLRMLAILDQSKVAWGDLANTIEQPANQFRVFENGVKNLAITIGKILMPVVSATMPYLNAMVKTLQSFFTWMANIFGIKLNVENSGTGTTDIFDSIEDSADDATESVNKLKKSIRSFDELNVIDTSSGGASGGATSGGGVDLSSEINSALAKYEKVWEEAYFNMNDKASQLAQNFEKALVPVKKLIEDIKIGNWFAVGGDVSAIASGIFNFFSDAIESVDWEKLGNNVGNFLAGIEWSEVIESGFDLGSNIFEAITDAWFKMYDTAPFETAIITALAGAKFLGLDSALSVALTTALSTAGPLSITLPLLTIVAGMIGISVEKEKGELYSNIDKYGEEKGKELSGNGTFDIAAQLRYDQEQQEQTLVQWYASLFGGWIEDYKWFQAEVDKTNRELEQAYVDMFSGIGQKIKTYQSDTETINGNINQVYVDTFNNIKEKFEEWKENSSNAIETFKNNIVSKFNAWKTNVGTTISNWKSDAESKFSTWKTNALNIVENFKTSTGEKFNAWKTNANNTISTWKTNAETSFSNFKTNTQATISEWYNKISSFFGFDKWSFSGIKDGLKSSFDNAISAIKSIWNTFANWLNKKLTWTIDPLKVGGVELFKGTTIKLGKIPTFANGGITSADIFAANENGVPELIGTIGRKSAIASGTEVTGIADAVYSTASEEMALLRQQNELLREILAKPTLSNNDVFRATKSAYRQEASRLGAQGNPALVWG